MIFCLAAIIAETGDSGHNLGLKRRAKLAIISVNSERIEGRAKTGSQIAKQGSFWANS
jgi:hypothetical protein